MGQLDDQTILDVARKIGFLNDDQIHECVELRKESDDASLPDILTQGGLITPDQLRALLVAARFEQTHDEDLALAAFAVANGFISKVEVERCLKLQEADYAMGDSFPRLQEILLNGNHINAQQMQMILRARAQIEATRVQLLATGAEIPTKPPTRRHRTPSSMEKPKAPEPAPAPETPAPSLPMPVQPMITRRTITRPQTYVEDFLKKHKDGAILAETLKVAIRRTKLRGKSDVELCIIDLFGSIDDAIVRTWEQYLAEVIERDGPRMILNCEGLTAVAKSAVNSLAVAAKHCHDRDGDLRLYGVSDKFKKAIHDAGHEAILRIYDSERGVVMSYKYM